MLTQYYTATSLDGFIADADNSLGWLFTRNQEEQGPQNYGDFIARVGALAMGSATYEWILDHEFSGKDPAEWKWPYAVPCWVFTHRKLPVVPNAPVEFTSGDVAGVHEEMVRAAGERNVWIVGGGDLAGQFADAGLLDEVIVSIAPVTLGAGAPLLPRRIELRLEELGRNGDFAAAKYSVVAPGWALRRGREPVERLRREAVERPDARLEVLRLRVLELRVREAAQGLDKQHHRWNAGACDLGRVVQRARREPVRLPRDLRDGLVGEPDQRLVERDRLDFPDPLPLDVDPFLLREPLRRLLRQREHPRELRRIEVTLVEQLLRGLDDRRHDPGPRHHAAGGTDRAVADLARDVADVERELRGAGERVAAPVHRRRPGVRGLAAPGDPRALDAERAEHHPERQVQRLEHRPLLDVQLEVRASVLELRARLERAVELHPVLAQRVRQRNALAIRQRAQVVLVGQRAGRRRRAEERAAEPGALLVGPLDEPDRDRRLALLRDPPQHLEAGQHVQTAVQPAPVRHRVDVTADQERPLRPATQREPLVPRLVDLELGAGRRDLRSQPLARALPRLGPGDPLRTLGVPRQLPELAQLLHRPSGRKRHGRRLYNVVRLARWRRLPLRALPRSAVTGASPGASRRHASPRSCSCWRRSGASGRATSGSARPPAGPGRSWSTTRRCRTSTTSSRRSATPRRPAGRRSSTRSSTR